MIVAVNQRAELSEFYPPPYGFLGPQEKCRACGLVHPMPIGMGDAGSQQINSIVTTGASATVAILTPLLSLGVIGAAAGALIAVLLTAVELMCLDAWERREPEERSAEPASGIARNFNRAIVHFADRHRLRRAPGAADDDTYSTASGWSDHAPRWERAA